MRLLILLVLLYCFCIDIGHTREITYVIYQLLNLQVDILNMLFFLQIQRVFSIVVFILYLIKITSIFIVTKTSKMLC